MSCNGCRVLRKGCSGDSCVIRPCLHWIESPQAQGHAVLFLSRFFGRTDLMSLISAVPLHKRPALFQSLLFDACGRTINPVNGAVGLLATGNWQLCQSAVQTILNGGTLQPLQVWNTGVGTLTRNSGGNGACSEVLPELFCGNGRRSHGKMNYQTKNKGAGDPELLQLFV